MFADGCIHVFYDANHVLSAITKFLVYLLQEGRKGSNGKRRGEERERGKKGEGMEGREMVVPQNATYGIWERPMRATMHAMS